MNSGKVPVNVLKRSVLRQLKNKRTEIANSAGLGADCAVFAPFSKGQMVTCVQEGVVELQCENDLAEAEREDLSVMPMRRIFQKCANNLAAAGAEPVAAELVIFLPETVEEPELKALMEEAEKAATDLNIQIIGGQTRVSSAVRQPIATATGYGILSEAAVTQVSEWKKLAGQDIIITKWIGLEGTADLAARNRENLLERYPAYLVEEAAAFDRYYSILPEAATAVKSGPAPPPAVKSGGCTMHDVSEGGVFAALWEMAEGAGVGLTIDMKKLPLRQETVEVCEFCNVNPYELRSGGSLIIANPEGTAVVEALAAEGIPAVIVGRFTDSNERLILNEDEVRYMDRPQRDEIYKNV
ncbi:hydrogenase maturation factor [Firmicutes bacterium CAG:65]|nr:hydrogenase maturation factor [Firmicutes bacterium CAG:65]